MKGIRGPRRVLSSKMKPASHIRGRPLTSHLSCIYHAQNMAVGFGNDTTIRKVRKLSSSGKRPDRYGSSSKALAEDCDQRPGWRWKKIAFLLFVIEIAIQGYMPDPSTWMEENHADRCKCNCNAIKPRNTMCPLCAHAWRHPTLAIDGRTRPTSAITGLHRDRRTFTA